MTSLRDVYFMQYLISNKRPKSVLQGTLDGTGLMNL